ncbi:hypothetical protein Tco_0887368 [Tanacetum coccineum]
MTPHQYPNLNWSNEEHEEDEDEYADKRVHTPENYELTNEKDNADNAKEETEEEIDDTKELYRDVNVNLRKQDVEMTDANQVTVNPLKSCLPLTKPFLHPPPSVTPLPQQETLTPTPRALEATTSFHALPYLSSVFRFNKRVTNMDKDLSKMKQVDQYAQSISSIPAIVDRYIGNKQGEAIQQAINSQTAKCREEALADKKEYIDLNDTSVRAIIKEEVKT